MHLHVGNGLVALSVAALLLAGPRLLDAEAFVHLSLAWTLTAAFGFGVAMPTEQLLIRALSAGPEGSGSGAMRYLYAVGAGSFVLLIALAPQLGSAPWAPAIGVGVAGWVIVTPARGRSAGRGDLQGYLVMLLLEAGARIALIAAALAWSHHREILFAAAVGVPLLVAGSLGTFLERAPLSPSTFTRVVGSARESAAFVAIAAAYQLMLSCAPVIIASSSGRTAPLLVGGFVLATAVLRAPTIVAGGFVTAGLRSLTMSWSAGQHHAFASEARQLTWKALLLAGLPAAALLAASPWLVPLLLGRDTSVPFLVLFATAWSTGLATASLVLTTAHQAAHHSWVAFGCWLSGALVVVSCVLLDPLVGAPTAWGLLAGSSLTFLGLLLTMPAGGGWRRRAPRAAAGATTQ